MPPPVPARRGSAGRARADVTGWWRVWTRRQRAVASAGGGARLAELVHGVVEVVLHHLAIGLPRPTLRFRRRRLAGIFEVDQLLLSQPTALLRVGFGRIVVSEKRGV